LELMHMSNKITIKSEFNNDLRRFTVNEPVALAELTTTLKNLYKIDNVDEVRLKYKDEEGDAISITTDEEFNEALNFAKDNNNLLRLSIGLMPLNLSSWVFVDTLPAVQELCKDIKQLSEQLKVSTPNRVPNESPSQSPSNNINNNNNSSSPREPSPTELQSSQLNQQQEGEGEQQYDLPKWGKSMDSNELVALGGHETPQGDNNIEIPTEIQHKREKISSIVSEYSANVVHDLKEITAKIASLVIEKGASFPMEMKDDLIQTNMKLAEMTIANCQTFSNNAAHLCNEFSDMTLNIVNNAVNSKPNYEDSEEYKANDQICNSLRSKTIDDCNSLSSKTSESCVKGADAIRDLIMNL